MAVGFLKPSELADHKDFLILDASYYLEGGTEKARSNFAERAIPGARFWDIDACADPHSTLPHMLAPNFIFARFLAGSGWQKNQPICVYDQTGLFSAPRLAWELSKREVTADIYLLAGGLPAWEQANLPLASGAQIIEPTEPSPDLWWKDTFGASYSLSNVYDELQSTPAVAGQIVDARSPGRFEGREPEPRTGLRKGHIPGSINLPFPSVVQNGRFASDFGLGLIDLKRPIITTCGSGITAAGLALALESRGAKRVFVYDGSWAQWGDPVALTPVAIGQRK